MAVSRRLLSMLLAFIPFAAYGASSADHGENRHRHHSRQSSRSGARVPWISLRFASGRRLALETPRASDSVDRVAQPPNLDRDACSPEFILT